MRTQKEVLDFLEEQMNHIHAQSKECGIKLPILATIHESTPQTLEQKYWIYHSVKLFIQGKI